MADLLNSSSSAQTAIISPSTTSDPIITIPIPVFVKLTQANFLTWKSQIFPLIRGFKLSRFIDSPPPSATVTTDGNTVPNPEFLSWLHQDQVLLGWIRSTLSEAVMAQFVSCSSTSGHH
jgi:hypothetical protein